MSAINVCQIYMSRRILHSSCGAADMTTHLVVQHSSPHFSPHLTPEEAPPAQAQVFSIDKPMSAELIKRSLQIADIEQNPGPIPGRGWIWPIYPVCTLQVNENFPSV